jgi:hypothetical protein
MNPKPGPHGRTITFNPKGRGGRAVFRIHCGGGDYEIPWADLCNPDAPKAAPAPQGHCDDTKEEFKAIKKEVQVITTLRKYIRELDCSVQVTCTIEYKITTQEWKCVGRQWQTEGGQVVTNQCTERSYIFQCC